MLNSLCIFVRALGLIKSNNNFIFTLVDLKKLAYQIESFIMEEQAKYMFYVQDFCDEK